MQNKANYMRFSPENADFTKKQSQFKPNLSQNKPNSNPILRKEMLYSMILRAYPNNSFVMRMNEKFETNMEKQKTAYIYAAAAIVLWATIAAAFKLSLPYYSNVLNLHILHLLFYASFIASIALFLNLLISKKLNLLKDLSKNDYLHSAMLGFLNPFLYYLVVLNAYNILTAQEAMTINWLWTMTLVTL